MKKGDKFVIVDFDNEPAALLAAPLSLSPCESHRKSLPESRLE
jgi:hypothetical protein